MDRVELPEHIGHEIFRVEVGSGLHGVAIEGTDDHDELGVCIENPEYWAGLKRFETWTYRTQPEGVRSGPGDLDLTIHSLRKFMKLALNGNPTIIQVLFVPPRKTLYVESDGGPSALHQLRNDLVDKIVSRRAGYAYLGYLRAQRQRMTGERGQKDVRRPELVARYGWDTKFGFHALRLGLQGIELMTTGKVTLPVMEEERQLLLSIREGRVSEAETLKLILDAEARLEKCIHGAGQVDMGEQLAVREEPDFEAVNEWVTRVYLASARIVG